MGNKDTAGMRVVRDFRRRDRVGMMRPIGDVQLVFDHSGNPKGGEVEVSKAMRRPGVVHDPGRPNSGGFKLVD